MLHSLWENVVPGKRLSRLPKRVADPREGSGTWGGTAPPYLRGLNDRTAPLSEGLNPPLRASLGEPVVG